MKVAEVIVVGGNYMGVWEEGPNSWKWKLSSKETVPIPLHRNSSYDDMVRSVIENGELDCEPKNVVISYVMNGRGKIHSTFINNDRHVPLYMLDVAADGSRLSLRINVVPGSPIIPPPQPTINEHDSFENESLNAHPMELKNPSFSKEVGEECGLGAQTNHTFSDETNFRLNQMFSSKKELKLLLDVTVVRNSFGYAMLKSCGKFLKVKCICPSCAWMLQVKKYECTDRFFIYKYVDDHNCGVKYATRSHRKITSKVIAALCVNMYHEGNGPNTSEIRRIIFKNLRNRPTYWKYWLGCLIAKEMVRGTAEHGYSSLSAFSYMIDALNVGTTYSIMVNKTDCRIMNYFLALGPCIRGFAHLRRVIAVDDTHLYGKFEGVLLSAVAQDTENHIYPIVFCVVDKENDASWTFFFEKLKSIVVDGPDLCFILDRHKSIARAYDYAHHGYCIRHLGENLWVNHRCGEHLYRFYNATKAYSPEVFSNHFEEFKNYCPEAAFFLEHELDFDKWSSAYFPGNRFDVKTSNITESINSMLIAEREYPVAFIFNLIDKIFGDIFRERRAYVLKCKDNKFMSTAEKILRDNMSEGDSFYMENISGDKSKFTLFDSGCTAKVNLLKRSCSCRKFELVKISCAHPITSLQLKHGDDYGLRVYDYSPPVYKVEEYLLAYSKSINIVPLESE
ncbi:hypothetical protein P3L10_023219 [Capsicum annuum]|uniref:uncharacterized protein LOC107879254 n=1 Tax=Capsicum annuum TaxID=4072 RepID=UPI001FB1141F|nr:uncharacterized protein LOC107879254 [Capsicum annuum]